MSNPIMEHKEEAIGSHFLVPFAESLSIRAHIRINENEMNDPRQARNYFYDTADQIPPVLPCSNPHCFEGLLDLKMRILEAVSQQQTYIQESFVCQNTLSQGSRDLSEACLYFCEYEIWLNY